MSVWDCESDDYEESRLFDCSLLEAGQTSTPGEGSAKRGKRQRTAKKNSLSTAEKHILVDAVKAHKEIWDLQDPRHSNTNAVKNGWKEIAEEVGKSVTECKGAWTSLRESHRYRKRARIAKSGAEGGEIIPVASCSQEWEFQQKMEFLPDIASKRRTIELTPNPCTRESSTPKLSSQGVSNYEYAKRPSTSSVSLEENSSSSVASSIERYVEIAAKQNEQLYMEYFPMLLNIDKLLRRLPPDEVQEVNIEMLKIILNRINKNKNEWSRCVNLFNVL